MAESVRRLEYQVKGGRKISNLSVVQEGMSQVDRVRLVRAMLGSQAKMGRVRVEDEAEFRAMVDFWHVPGKNDEILQVFEMRQEELLSKEGLDLTHLLPAIPRQLVNRYPQLTDMNKKAAPDCVWTVMNFFEARAWQRHLDGYALSYYLEKGFRRVTREPQQFGDIVILTDEEGEFVHAYVQVVEDELVFTKNGRGMGYPWALMSRDVMMAHYGALDHFQVSRFRSLN